MIKTHILHLVNNPHVLCKQNTVQNSYEKNSSENKNITWDFKKQISVKSKVYSYYSGIQQESTDTATPVVKILPYQLADSITESSSN